MTEPKNDKISELFSDVDGNSESISDRDLQSLKLEILSLEPTILDDIDKIKHPWLKNDLEARNFDFWNALALIRKVMWDKFFHKIILKESSSEVTVPNKAIVDLVESIFELEKARNTITLKTIILTMEELEDLERQIVSWISVKEFINKQSSETISSKEIIVWTDMDKKLTEILWSKENAERFSDQMDWIWLKYIESTLWENVGSDVKRNMATWMSFVMMERLNSAPNEVKNKVFNDMKNLVSWDVNSLMTYFKDIIVDVVLEWWEKVVSNIRWLDKVLWIVGVVNEYLWDNNNWKNNEILMNPNKFRQFTNNIVDSDDLNNDNIKSRLKDAEKSKVEVLSKSDLIDLMNVANKSSGWLDKTIVNWMQKWAIYLESFNQVQWEGFKGVVDSIKSFKWQIADQIDSNKDDIFSITDTLKSLGVWEFVKKIIDFIFKMLWYKWWFDDFEKKHRSLDDNEKALLDKLFNTYIWEKPWDKDIATMSSIWSDLKLEPSDARKSAIMDFKPTAFKLSLEKNSWLFSDLNIKWERFGKYHIPLSVLRLSWKDVFTDLTKMNVDTDKLSKVEELIVDDFIKNTTWQIIWTEALNDKINSHEDLAKFLYSEFIKPWVTKAGIDFNDETVWVLTATAILSSKLQLDPMLKEDFEKIKWKKLNQLTFDESVIFFRSIFWDWPWTNLAIVLSQSSPVFLTRIVALWTHEWWLRFWRINHDPNTDSWQSNIWTFQISAKFTWTDNVIIKYLDTMKKWLEMSGNNSVDIDALKNSNDVSNVTRDNYWTKVQKIQNELNSKWLNLSQQDLLSWLWFVALKSNSESIFQRLRDSSLSKWALINLISDEIQVGISAIWSSVNSQLTSNSVDNYVA